MELFKGDAVFKVAMPKAHDDECNSACFVYDFTLFWPGDERPDVGTFCRHLSEHCKKYAFQMERAPTTDRLHYQGRFSLKEKLRKWNAVALVCVGDYKDMSIKPTSNANKGNEFYVTKTETRVEGPWTDRDPPKLRSVEKMVTLRPWQEQLKNLLLPYDQRCVNVLIDPAGNSGKTSFLKYMNVYHQATWIPPLYAMKDIMQFAMSIPPSKIYIINMPRAMNKTQLGEFYAGMEQMKDGMLYDTRYKGRQLIMDEPNILILTNTEPEMDFLSKDRWNLWKIERDVLCNWHI